MTEFSDTAVKDVKLSLTLESEQGRGRLESSFGLTEQGVDLLRKKASIDPAVPYDKVVADGLFGTDHQWRISMNVRGSLLGSRRNGQSGLPGPNGGSHGCGRTAIRAVEPEVRRMAILPDEESTGPWVLPVVFRRFNRKWQFANGKSEALHT